MIITINIITIIEIRSGSKHKNGDAV